MKFNSYEIGGSVEILASKDYQSIPAKIVAPDGGATLVKAGSPINENGEVTTGAGAVGILLYDVETANNPNGALVVAGIIDAKKAQAHAGIEYAAALYAALPAVNFRTNIGVNP